MRDKDLTQPSVYFQQTTSDALMKKELETKPAKPGESEAVLALAGVYGIYFICRRRQCT